MSEEQSITISALQHFVYCPRQCALIHTERVWAENALTTFGKIEHSRVETAQSSTLGSLRTTRSESLASLQYGIHGVVDVVEYDHSFSPPKVTPVEYKHGKPKVHDADIIQLCAQALCLEEMRHCHISEGFLFYHACRHRHAVAFSAELRQKTIRVIEQTRELLQSGVLPPASRRPDCSACSLVDLCLPVPCPLSAAAYNERIFPDLLNNETTP